MHSFHTILFILKKVHRCLAYLSSPLVLNYIWWSVQQPIDPNLIFMAYVIIKADTLDRCHCIMQLGYTP